MTAFQRVEDIIDVLKKRRISHRRSSLVRAKTELQKPIDEIALRAHLRIYIQYLNERAQSNRLSTQRRNLGQSYVESHLLKSVDPLRKKLARVRASTYAKNVSLRITAKVVGYEALRGKVSRVNAKLEADTLNRF